MVLGKSQSKLTERPPWGVVGDGFSRPYEVRRERSFDSLRSLRMTHLCNVRRKRFLSCKLYNYLCCLPLTFWEVACKIYAVWCTLPVLLGIAFHFYPAFMPGYAFCALCGVFVMRFSGYFPVICHAYNHIGNNAPTPSTPIF